ncbi:MAG: methylated-DNA--[protein]-cysteine S-methyltransferase [Limnochordia bacterium]|jgi:methylated-DNA-[protein]-cysteine S-methyltransferase
MVVVVHFPTIWGWMSIEYGPRGLKRITFPAPQDGRREGNCPEHISQFIAECQRYFAGQGRGFSPIDIDIDHLPPFSRRVLRECGAIPYGRVVTYKELAQRVGSPQAARAVGQVMAHNPLPILIPCHRVIGSDGRLTGFGGGLTLKKRLLRLEGLTVD